MIAGLRRKTSEVTGVRVFLSNPPAIRIGGQNTRSLYQYTLQSVDTSALYENAPKLERTLRAMPGIVDVSSDLQLANPQVNIELDRPRIAALGLTVDQVQSAMASAYSNAQVSTIYAPTNQYQVIMRVAPEYQDRPDALSLLFIKSSNGALIPLANVASFKPGVGPQQVNHVSQLPSVTLSFNLAPGTSLGDATARVEDAARNLLPATIVGSFQGTAQAFQDSLTGLGLVLLMAIFVIYIVLGILYESFIHPLTILSGLPAAGLGALATLWLFGVDLNLYAFVGVIMLVGLVKKNGIMMIDFAIEAQRTEKITAHDAIYEACMVRFRPDHDDDDGGAGGDAADCDGHRRRRRGAPAAGPGRGRRPARVADADAVHHAGLLPVPRGPVRQADPQAPASGPGQDRRVNPPASPRFTMMDMRGHEGPRPGGRLRRPAGRCESEKTKAARPARGINRSRFLALTPTS